MDAGISWALTAEQASVSRCILPWDQLRSETKVIQRGYYLLSKHQQVKVFHELCQRQSSIGKRNTQIGLPTICSLQCSCVFTSYSTESMPIVVIDELLVSLAKYNCKATFPVWDWKPMCVYSKISSISVIGLTSRKWGLVAWIGSLVKHCCKATLPVWDPNPIHVYSEVCPVESMGFTLRKVWIGLGCGSGKPT